MGQETSTKFFRAALLAVGLHLPAHAATLGVLDLRLHPDAAWQRGTPQQEEEDDALQLSWAGTEGVALQVLVFRKPPLIKPDADTFYRNLARKWDAQYGKAASVDWLDLSLGGAGGGRWLSCRRPASSGEGVAFHLVTAHEGRAYSLLVFAPPGTEALPRAVGELLAGARFQTQPPLWRSTLSLPVLPHGEALEALVQAEAEALGEKGMLTGHDLKAEYPPKTADADVPSRAELRLRWYLDGFRWNRASARDERLPFMVQGTLVAEVSPELEGGELKLFLVGDGERVLAARVRQHAYCGPRTPWEDALASLRNGAHAPLSHLAREHACPGQAGQGDLATVEAGAGQQATRTITLAPPPAKAVGLWVEVRLLPEPGTVGEGLLDRLGLYFFYAPQP